MGPIHGLLAFAFLVAASWTNAASSQEYSTRPVTIVVPFAPGATTDTLGRIAAEVLQRELKTSFIVENRTGAGGVIGNTAVARSGADNPMLLFTPTAFAILPQVYKNLPYDSHRDFKPVTLMGYTGYVMVVSPSLDVKTVKDFITLAKSGTKHMTYASPGTGTPAQLAVEAFAAQAGIKLQHVPYRGTSPALIDVMSGEVTMMFADLGPAVPLIQAGQLKVLGVLTPERHPSLPGVPAVSETIPGFSVVGWQGLLAPAGTSDADVNKLNAALVAYLKTPEAAERLKQMGVDVKWTTPKEMEDWIVAQLAWWGKVAKDAGIEPQ
jgi:tripartite-type tricarboxylate transporter receptor subunit TctC